MALLMAPHAERAAEGDTMIHDLITRMAHHDLHAYASDVPITVTSPTYVTPGMPGEPR